MDLNSLELVKLLHVVKLSTTVEVLASTVIALAELASNLLPNVLVVVNQVPT
jgi:hypothetical protein